MRGFENDGDGKACHFNQVLQTLFHAGPWSSAEPGGPGHLIIQLLNDLQTQTKRALAEVDRDNVVRAIFGPEGTTNQQDFHECLAFAMSYLAGTSTTVEMSRTHTCSACGANSRSFTTAEQVILAASNEDEVDLEAMLNVKMNPAQYKCGTSGCKGNSMEVTCSVCGGGQQGLQSGECGTPECKGRMQVPSISNECEMMVNGLPEKLILSFKRNCYEGRSLTNIKIPDTVMVQTITGDEQTIHAYGVTYVVMHGSYGLHTEDNIPGRSTYNVCDEDERSYSGWESGHYFGVAFKGERTTMFYDDAGMSEGTADEVAKRGRKIVCVVLQRKVEPTSEHHENTHLEKGLTIASGSSGLPSSSDSTEVEPTSEHHENTHLEKGSTIASGSSGLPSSSDSTESKNGCSHKNCAGALQVDQCSTPNCEGKACHMCSIKVDDEQAENNQSWRICARCAQQTGSSEHLNSIEKSLTIEKGSTVASGVGDTIRDKLRGMIKVQLADRTNLLYLTAHRLANQVFLHLMDSDEAERIPLFTAWVGKAGRREKVRELFHEAGVSLRQIVTSTLAWLWGVTINVHNLDGLGLWAIDEYKPGEPRGLPVDVVLEDNVLYPTCTTQTIGDGEVLIKEDNGKCLVATKAFQLRGYHAEFDTAFAWVYPFVVTLAESGKFGMLPQPPRAQNVSGGKPIPVKLDSTYKLTTKSMRIAGMEGESSKLRRSADKSTVIECSYSMMHSVISIVETYWPFTSESIHIILGQGRRGALLIELLTNKDISIIALERGDVHNEAVSRMAQLQASDPDYRPKICMVRMDAKHMQDLTGCTSASRFVGGSGAGSSSNQERDDIDRMVLNCRTMKVYWTNHLRTLTKLGLADEVEQQWVQVMLSGQRQENNRYNTYLWVRVDHTPTTTPPSKAMQDLITSANSRAVYVDLTTSTPTDRGQRKSNREMTPLSRYDPSPRSPATLVNQRKKNTPSDQLLPAAVEILTPARAEAKNKTRASTGEPKNKKSKPPSEGSIITPPSESQNTRSSARKQREANSSEPAIPTNRVLAAEFEEATKDSLREISERITVLSTDKKKRKKADDDTRADVMKELHQIRSLLADDDTRVGVLEQLHQIRSKIADDDTRAELMDELRQIRSQLGEAGTGTNSTAVLEDIITRLQSQLTDHHAAVALTLTAEHKRDKQPDRRNEVKDLRDELLGDDRKQQQQAIALLTTALAKQERDQLWLERQRDLKQETQAKIIKAHAKEKKKVKKIKTKAKFEAATAKAEAALAEQVKIQAALAPSPGANVDQPEHRRRARRSRSRSRSQQRSERRRSRSRSRHREQQQGSDHRRFRRSRSQQRSERRRSRSRSRHREQQQGSDHRRFRRSRSRQSRSQRSRSRSQHREQQQGTDHRRFRWSRSRRSRSRSQHREQQQGPDHRRPQRSTPSSQGRAPASVFECAAQGVVAWLAANHYATHIQNKFLEANICGGDLKRLSDETLHSYGMPAHSVQRFHVLMATADRRER